MHIYIFIYKYAYTSIGIENAVGTLGTAITKSQMDLAGKYLSGR
jgi:DNA primase